MPAQRKTLKQLKGAGTYRADRHANRPQKVLPIDPTPPDHLDEDRAAAWSELVAAGQDYLAASDRFAVELAAGLLVRVRAGDAKAADIAQLNNILNKLGLTPMGRRGLEPLRDPEEKDGTFAFLDS